MAGTKHIRKSYKKREGAPLRLGTGRLCGLLAAAELLADGLGGWSGRRMADAGLSGRRRGKEGGPPPGVVVLAVASRAAG